MITGCGGTLVHIVCTIVSVVASPVTLAAVAVYPVVALPAVLARARTALVDVPVAIEPRVARRTAAVVRADIDRRVSSRLRAGSIMIARRGNTLVCIVHTVLTFVAGPYALTGVRVDTAFGAMQTIHGGLHVESSVDVFLGRCCLRVLGTWVGGWLDGVVLT